MAVAFRNKTISTFASAANITATEPASAAADDILIAWLYIESDTAVTPPAGWTNTFATIAMLSECNTASDAFRLYAYWIRRGGSAPALGWTFASSFRGIYVAAYSGALASGDPFSFADHQVRDTTAARTIPNCSGTTVDANEMLVWGAGTFANPTGTTVPTGYTSRQAMSSTISLASADLIQAGAGAASSTGAAFTGGSTETTGGQLVGLRPDAGGGAVGQPFDIRAGQVPGMGQGGGLVGRGGGRIFGKAA